MLGSANLVHSAEFLFGGGSGGIGRRAGFKIRFSKESGGSSPPSRTNLRNVWQRRSLSRRILKTESSPPITQAKTSRIGGRV